MRIKYFWVILLVVSACGEKEEEKLFTLLSPDDSNIKFINEVEEAGNFNIIEYLYYFNGGGVAVGDINNDGLDDIFFTANSGKNKLYLNKGDLKFDDITMAAGVDIEGDWSTGVTMADVNNDGLLDIYVCELGHYKNIDGYNKLFINQGDLTFIESAQAYGLDFSGYSTQAAFFDKDLDGDLDVYLLNNSVHGVQSYGQSSLRNTNDLYAGDKIYENRLDTEGRFVDVTSESGIFSSPLGYGLGVGIADINSDGYPDIYVSNDFHENDYLYINKGDGTFFESLEKRIAHTSRYSMGNDLGDLNNDGDIDLITLDMLPEDPEILLKSVAEDKQEVFDIKKSYGYNDQFVRNTVQINNQGKFSDLAPMWNMHATDWSWAPIIADFNADGWNDVYISNGIYKRPNDLNYIQYLANVGAQGIKNSDSLTKEMIRRMPTLKISNYLFLNNGGLNFQNNTQEWGLDIPSYSNGVAYGDLDNDGDLEIVVNNLNQEAFLLRNNQLKKNYLTIQLKGKQHNLFGIGARVQVYSDGKTQTKEVYTTRGFQSGVPPYVYFGLGDRETVDSIKIVWSKKNVQWLKEVNANQKLVITEKAGDPLNSKGEDLVNFKTLPFSHKENVTFKDYQYEFLMPYMTSREGPAVAVGDINDNGHEEIFMGGARYQAPAIFHKSGDSFEDITPDIIKRDSAFEDIDAIFFDANGDKRLDLYVVSGGADAQEGNQIFQDRLYLNLQGGWLKNKLPNTAASGSTVTAGDVDGDGDMDLFIGTRAIPGGYGFPATQFILLNDGEGNFKDVTQKYSSELLEFGLVTDAQWSDIDNDGDHDLIIVGDWLPVTVMRNDNGKLVNVSKEYKTDSLKGWWRSLKVQDINNDGYVDLVVGNFGINNKLKPSSSQPLSLYLSDFDGNARPDPVIFYYQENEQIPLKSKDDLARQMPVINKTFTDYVAFSKVRSIGDLMPNGESGLLYSKMVNEFRSGIYYNNQGTSFKWTPLPDKVQWSVVNSIEKVSDDILLFAGNSKSNYVEIGNVDAFPGLVFYNLKNNKVSFQNLDNRYIKKVITLNLDGKDYFLTVSNDDSARLIPDDFIK